MTIKELRVSPADLLPFLQRVSLFSDLQPSALALFARVSRVRTVEKGQVVFDKDDPGEAAYIVRSGTIAITLNTPDGRELIINEMHEGDCFGELALVTGEPRSAGAIARDMSELVVIPRAEFLDELEREPALMRHVLQITAGWLRRSTERESALAFLDAPARLAQLLLELDRRESATGYLTVSQEEIGQRVGVARQTAARILGQWRRAGWILTGRGRIVLLNRNALRKQAEETHGGD